MRPLTRIAVCCLFVLLTQTTTTYSQCNGPAEPCSVCGVSATITSINGGTIVNGTSNISGILTGGSVGTGSNLEVTANACGSISMTVQLAFNWDQGINLNWIHGVSFGASPGWTAAQGMNPGAGWNFLGGITGCCSGAQYGPGYYWDTVADDGSTPGCCTESR